MTRARHVTHRKTAARVEKLRILINALLANQMERDAIGQLLQVGPSGVRKYIAELGAMVTRRVDVSAALESVTVYRLAITAAEAQAYLDDLTSNTCARAVVEPKSSLLAAARDPSRHFHIMRDDAHFSVRVSRTPPMRDPMVAALFGGAGRHEVRA